MEIRELRLEEINPAEYNPRLRMMPKSFEYKALGKSLEEFGLVVPLVVNVRTMTLISGHQRYWVLQDQGKETADCVIVDYDKDQEKALNLALNKIDGEYDYGKLADILEELKAHGVDMDTTGFREEQINDILNEIDEELFGSEFDIEKKPKKDDKKEGVKCLVGEYAFRIPTDIWEDTMAKIRLKVGYAKEKVIGELQRRLYRDEV
jgi:ParB-like chromosome segregation protein Spo0J